jgi:YHS domain-containing protein
MKNIVLAFLLSFLTLSINAQEDRNISVYNLNNAGTGFINGHADNANGYDPVSPFPEAEGSTLAGKKEFALDYEGVEYLFANAKNMKAFITNPKKYEPTYGGWCARAMVVGQKVHINTKLFTIVGNRSYFFVNKRAKRFFDRDIAGNSKIADMKWKELSGENPRL